MFDKINNEARFQMLLDQIEKILLNATAKGGFMYLPEAEKEELHKLSLLAEKYEDKVLQ